MLPTFLRKLPSLPASPETRPHPQFTWLTDTLSRSEQHHALIYSMLPEKWHLNFAVQYAHYLTQSGAPTYLKQAVCVYTDAYAYAPDQHTATFAASDNNTIIVTISLTGEIAPDAAIMQLIRQRMNDPRWRFIFLCHPIMASTLRLPRHGHVCAILNTPTVADTFSLLKQECTRLSEMHQISIPDETLKAAFFLASRWLKGHSPVEKTLQLLDSAAARKAAGAEALGAAIPVSLLTEITSDWTRVPVAYLQENRFRTGPLSEALRQQIFGQDEAIYRVARLLQTAGLRLQENRSEPLCHFLLTGPQYSGKSTLAHELASYITGHRHGLIRFHFSDPLDDLANAVYDRPYSVVLMENIDAFSTPMRLAVREILTTGRLRRQGQSDVDFTDTIMILTSHTAATPAIPLRSVASENGADLMHLVLGSQEKERITPMGSAAENITDGAGTLPPAFPDELKDLMRPIAFAPLSLPALEKTVKKHVTRIANTLTTRNGILLDVMPEATRFLAQTLQKFPPKQPVERLLDQYLLPPVAHRLCESGEKIHRTERLKVRLNGSGESLMCDWVSLQEMELH